MNITSQKCTYKNNAFCSEPHHFNVQLTPKPHSHCSCFKNKNKHDHQFEALPTVSSSENSKQIQRTRRMYAYLLMTLMTVIPSVWIWHKPHHSIQHGQQSHQYLTKPINLRTEHYRVCQSTATFLSLASGTSQNDISELETALFRAK